MIPRFVNQISSALMASAKIKLPHPIRTPIRIPIRRQTHLGNLVMMPLTSKRHWFLLLRRHMQPVIVRFWMMIKMLDRLFNKIL